MNAIVTIGTDVAKNVFAVHRSVGVLRRFVWKLQSWGRWCGASRRHDLTGSRLDVVHPQGLALMRPHHGRPWEKACRINMLRRQAL